MSPLPMDIRQLENSSLYKIQQDLTDFHHNRFTQEERRMFVEYHFLPYHGGCTLIFQADENAQILNSLGDFFCLVTESTY